MDDAERASILVVDDVENNRLLLQAVFEDLYEVIEADNGERALALLRQHEISAVVLDIVMPVLDGFGVLSIMQTDAKLREIPVLVVTASDDEQSQIHALELGAVDVVGKPFNPEVVRARVKNAVNRLETQKSAQENERLKYRLEQQQRELELSRYDTLTGLFNKQFYYQEIRRMLEEMPQRDFTIGRFDIDRFKVFNDVFGVEKGDELLRNIGRFMMTNFHGGLVSSRIEADHFSALFDRERLDPDTLVSQTQTWFKSYPAEFDFTIKAGFYEIDDRLAEPSVMCDRALLALKSVKAIAGTQVGHYDDSLRQKLIDEQALLSDMNIAFDREQFEVWFQPQYDYAQGQMSGAEALVRWIHPKRGIVYPGMFIPIMEKNGVITRLDEYVWERCCRHLRNWLDKLQDGELPPPISTNISRADLLRSNLADTFLSLTKKYGIPRGLLHLEITESAYMEDQEQLLSTVERLRGEGFTIEMDDFGSGYSSLNTLKDVPVDILKLDMKFVAGAQKSAKGGNILSSVIRMARWLNLPVIAEGIETKEQADYLKSIGCRLMQGYLFARPMPPERFETLYLSTGTQTGGKIGSLDITQAEPFWNVSNQNALIFNSFLGGAAILEYHNGNIEVLRTNDPFFEILQTTRAEYEPWMTHLQDRFEKKYADALIDSFARAAQEGEAEVETASRRLSGGQTLWIHSRVRVLAKSGGSMMIYIGIHNITDKKRAEAELLKKEELLRSLLSVFDEVIDTDLNRGVYTSHGGQGGPANEAAGLLENLMHERIERVHPDDRARLTDRLELLRKNRPTRAQDLSRLDYRVLRPDGRIGRRSLLLANPDSGRYLCCIMDISVRESDRN